MTFKIVETKNYGFTKAEIDIIIREFTSSLSKIKIASKHKVWIEAIELPDLDCIIIATYKKIDSQKVWQGEIFSKDKTLRIIANIE